MLTECDSLLDIGGGLRFDGSRGNKVLPQNAWIGERIRERGISYRVLDYVDTYHPDIVGDVQALPFPDASEGAIVCNAILEHVPDPRRAAGELVRVLRPGGYLFVFVPFLYYYHAEEGYYGDYWRFTEDALRVLFTDVASFELQKVRGPVETLVRLSPLGRGTFFNDLAFLLDRISGKLGSNQTSGYMLFLKK